MLQVLRSRLVPDLPAGAARSTATDPASLKGLGLERAPLHDPPEGRPGRVRRWTLLCGRGGLGHKRRPQVRHAAAAGRTDPAALSTRCSGRRGAHVFTRVTSPGSLRRGDPMSDREGSSPLFHFAEQLLQGCAKKRAAEDASSRILCRPCVRAPHPVLPPREERPPCRPLRRWCKARARVAGRF
jgi:hypothetical protein